MSFFGNCRLCGKNTVDGWCEDSDCDNSFEKGTRISTFRRINIEYIDKIEKELRMLKNQGGNFVNLSEGLMDKISKELIFIHSKLEQLRKEIVITRSKGATNGTSIRVL